MSNMSYCRFRNTLEDLRDCYDNFDDFVSQEESEARHKMYEICQNIVNFFDLEDIDENIKD